MYSREEIKTLVDKVLDMAKGDGVDLTFEGGERAGTRFANSSITTNLVQYDQQLTINIRRGQKQGSASTRELDDESLKAAVDEAAEAAERARDNPNLAPLVKGPQDYIAVDAVAPATAGFGPGERAAWVKQSIDICEKKGVLAAGYIPKAYQTNCVANSGALWLLPVRRDRFHPHLPHGERRRVGMGGHHRGEGSRAGEGRRAHRDCGEQGAE